MATQNSREYEQLLSKYNSGQTMTTEEYQKMLRLIEIGYGSKNDIVKNTTAKSDHRSARDNNSYAIYDNAGNSYTFDFNTKATGTGAKDKKTAAILEYLIKNGSMPIDATQVGMLNDSLFKSAIQNAKQLLTQEGYSEEYFRNQLLQTGQPVYDSYGRDISTQFYDIDADGNRTLKKEYQEAQAQREAQAEQTAYDSYWNNLYNKDNKNTLGGQAYDQLYNAEVAAGQNAIDLANAQAQQMGMAQAATVKNITDSLKAERMARLRAGMSESQIASQDMQTMIANTNALNEQIAAQNLAAMQGQQQIQNAQTTAYQNWLNAMNQTATPASAFAAADAGDAYMQTLKRMQQTNETYQKANEKVTGGK